MVEVLKPEESDQPEDHLGKKFLGAIGLTHLIGTLMPDGSRLWDDVLDVCPKDARDVALGLLQVDPESEIFRLGAAGIREHLIGQIDPSLASGT